MTTPQRILIVHDDAPIRRGLVMLLAEAGYEVRTREQDIDVSAEMNSARPDLVLIGHRVENETGYCGYDLASRVRDEDADVPIVMLLPELELPLVVRGIREGLTDVLPWHNDGRAILRRIHGLLGQTMVHTSAPWEPEEFTNKIADFEASLTELTRDRQADEVLAKFQQALGELRAEREWVDAAQAAMDERARLLADERDALNVERHSVHVMGERLLCGRQDLEEEKKLWQETLNDLQTREANLRDYEDRLRQCQGESPERPLTAPPFKVFPSQPSSSAATPPMCNEAQELAQGWRDLERARESFKSERAMVRDERMVLTDLEREIRRREERLRKLERDMEDRDRVRLSLPPPPPDAFQAHDAATVVALPPPTKRGVLSVFRRQQKRRASGED